MKKSLQIYPRNVKKGVFGVNHRRVFYSSHVQPKFHFLGVAVGQNSQESEMNFNGKNGLILLTNKKVSRGESRCD